MRPNFTGSTAATTTQGWRPSEAARKFNQLAAKADALANTLKELSWDNRSILDFRLNHSTTTAELEAKLGAVSAALEGVEGFLVFLKPENEAQRLRDLVARLAQVFNLVTGTKPTHTRSPETEEYTSAFNKFVHLVVPLIDPNFSRWRALAEAMNEACKPWRDTLSLQ